jgi:phosphonate transport system substrate-binding protein
MSKRVIYILLAVFTVMALVLSGCATPTAIPLGSPENPIIMAQAPSATTQELITGGELVAAKLSEMTGYTIQVVVPNSYAALVEAMGSGNAHIGWLPTFGYMLAKEKGYADVALVVIRSGSDHYGAQYIAHVDSGFTPYFDPAANANTAEAAVALAQFEGKKPCWTDPLSVSGYIIPLGFLNNLGIKTQAGAFVQGHPTVVTAVYSKGICDFGATYIDARTNSAVNEAHPDVQEKVVVIWRTDPVIPNDNVSIAVDVPADVREKIVNALVEISSTEEGQALLKAGGFDVQGLKIIDDTFYDEFRVYLQASGIDVTTLYPK